MFSYLDKFFLKKTNRFYLLRTTDEIKLRLRMCVHALMMVKFFKKKTGFSIYETADGKSPVIRLCVCTCTMLVVHHFF